MFKDPLILSIALAMKYHDGQHDKLGMPYIGHPLRVLDDIRSGAWGNDVVVQCAAVLHDVIEDAGISEAELVIQGVPPQAVHMVRQLSRLPIDGNKPTYISWILHLKKCSPGVRAIKLADLRDNLSPERFNKLPQELRAKLGPRYREAIEILIS